MEREFLHSNVNFLFETGKFLKDFLENYAPFIKILRRKELLEKNLWKRKLSFVKREGGIETKRKGKGYVENKNFLESKLVK